LGVLGLYLGRLFFTTDYNDLRRLTQSKSTPPQQSPDHVKLSGPCLTYCKTYKIISLLPKATTKSPARKTIRQGFEFKYVITR